MKYIKFFQEITKSDAALVGGKGASLGEMTKLGIRVPSGFVITVKGFDRFLEEHDLGAEIQTTIGAVNPDDANSVESASEKIRDVMHDCGIPSDLEREIKDAFKKLKAKLAAVRSSATAEDSSIASWAGELETYLNTKEDALSEKVTRCWSSLFTPRAIFYRFEKKLGDINVKVGVVVQEMVQSEAAGVCFTVHPVTKDADQMIIEAGWGLGEAVVSGQITPDSYVIGKKEGIILDINISKQDKELKFSRGCNKWIKVSKTKKDKQKLSTKQIIKLSELCKKIEIHYGCPQDIEWAFEDNHFYITQSRPITTLC